MSSENTETPVLTSNNQENINSIPCSLYVNLSISFKFYLCTIDLQHSCRRQFSKYTCPKCNVPYCSLICFRSQVCLISFLFWDKNIISLAGTCRMFRIVLSERNRIWHQSDSFENDRRKTENDGTPKTIRGGYFRGRSRWQRRRWILKEIRGYGFRQILESL